MWVPVEPGTSSLWPNSDTTSSLVVIPWAHPNIGIRCNNFLPVTNWILSWRCSTFANREADERNKSINWIKSLCNECLQPDRCSLPFSNRWCWRKAYQHPSTRHTLSFSTKALFSTEYPAWLLIENQLCRVRGKDMERDGIEREKIISPTPGDLRLSKFVIDIFLMSENIELVERRLSPKLMMLVTDNFRLSLCDLSGSAAFTWFPDGLLFTWILAPGDGEVGDCSNGSDNDDLFMTIPSSCSCCSSSIVAGWLWLDDTKRFSFSSCPFDCGDVGGEPGKMVIGGGDGVAELIDCWVPNGSPELVGDSGGSEIQIDACWTVSLSRSWFDFCWGKLFFVIDYGAS